MPQEEYQYIKLPDGSHGKFRSDATDADIRTSISKDFPDAFKGKPSLYEQGRQSYEAKKGKVDTPGVSEGAGLREGLGDWVEESFGNMGRSVSDFWGGKMARGGHELLTGLENLMAPAAVMVAPTAPLSTARALAGGTAGGYMGKIGGKMVGLSPDQADLAGDIGGIAGGTLATMKLPRMGSAEVEPRSKGVRAPEQTAQTPSEMLSEPEASNRMVGSEGRPATWTNERVLQLARQGNRDAIAQVARRGLKLPENARYVAGDIDYPRAVQNPRDVTLFSPEGTPIRMGGKRSYLGLIPSKKMKLPDEAPR
jgi:hypothetical protein